MGPHRPRTLLPLTKRKMLIGLNTSDVLEHITCLFKYTNCILLTWYIRYNTTHIIVLWIMCTVEFCGNSYRYGIGADDSYTSGTPDHSSWHCFKLGWCHVNCICATRIVLLSGFTIFVCVSDLCADYIVGSETKTSGILSIAAGIIKTILNDRRIQPLGSVLNLHRNNLWSSL